MREFMGCFVDVWQSMRLLTAGSLVRVQLEEPKKASDFRGFLVLYKIDENIILRAAGVVRPYGFDTIRTVCGDPIYLRRRRGG